MMAKKLSHCKIFTVMTNHIYTFRLQFPLRPKRGEVDLSNKREILKQT